MFAPCLLGCHGTVRQRPVPDGTGFHRLPYNSARHSISRHYPTQLNWQSSGLLIRWCVTAGRALDAAAARRLAPNRAQPGQALTGAGRLGDARADPPRWPRGRDCAGDAHIWPLAVTCSGWRGPRQVRRRYTPGPSQVTESLSIRERTGHRPPRAAPAGPRCGPLPYTGRRGEPPPVSGR